jgi:hypothetical protein
MDPKMRWGLPTLLASLACAAGTWAESMPDASMADLLETMRAEIQRLHEDNARMQREIDELKASTNDNWLTARRSDEIRGLVAEVLADADVRAASLQGGLTAGWSDHFYLASPDGRFKLQLEGQMQIRWVYSYHDIPDRHRHGFENTRTKLTFRGHAFNPDLTYLIRGNFGRSGGGFSLEDAWVQYRMSADWLVRIGQFKIPYGREELVSSARQLAVERSLVSENTNFGRSQGVELIYAQDDWKVLFMVHDGIEDNFGGFDAIQLTTGGNTPALTQDVEWALSARYEYLFAGEWDQFDDFTSPPDGEYGLLLGLAGTYQQFEYGEGVGPFRDEPRMLAVNADLSAEWGGANAFGSFTWSYNDNPDFPHIYIYGFVLQGGVYFTPRLEVFSRYEYGWWDFDGQDFADLHVITFGANYYLKGHDAKWTTDIGFGIGRTEGNWDSDLAGWREDAGRSEPQIVFRTQFQLLF